jgi:hypothetical protein
MKENLHIVYVMSVCVIFCFFPDAERTRPRSRRYENDDFKLYPSQGIAGARA